MNTMLKSSWTGHRTPMTPDDPKGSAPATHLQEGCCIACNHSIALGGWDQLVRAIATAIVVASLGSVSVVGGK